MTELRIFPVAGIGEIGPDDDLAQIIADAAEHAATPLADGDCLVVTQKIVSKAEGRLVAVDHDDLGARAALVEAESARIVRRRGDLIISETRHGFVCANAGIDLSNVELGYAALLPLDPDFSAHRIRQRLGQRGLEVAVIISDTFGRPWRTGVTDVAIGVSGLVAVLDLRGTADAQGRILQVTEVCLADEVASAAELVMGKALGHPAAVVRGLDPSFFGGGRAAHIVRPPAEDLFR